jgi:hypothetical protein
MPAVFARFYFASEADAEAFKKRWKARRRGQARGLPQLFRHTRWRSASSLFRRQRPMVQIAIARRQRNRAHRDRRGCRPA